MIDYSGQQIGSYRLVRLLGMGRFASVYLGQHVRIATQSDKTVKLWDAYSGQLLHTCVGHSDWVRAVVWSPDSKRVASASDDSTMRLWDAHSGQLLHTCTGHTDRVVAVAWSPDGSVVASASLDHTVRLWQGI